MKLPFIAMNDAIFIVIDLNWIHENYQSFMTVSNPDRLPNLVENELSKITSI